MANQVILYAEPGYFPDGYVAEYATTKIDHLDFKNKLIFLKTGTVTYHPVDDLYKEVRYIRSHDYSLRNMRMPITAEGAIPKGGGKFTPRLAILRYGWRIVPQNVTHSLYISGEQITDDGQSGPACMNTAVLDAGVSVTIHYEPATAEMLSGTGGSTGPTAAEIAAAILAAAQITPIHSDMRKAVGQAYHGDGSEGNKLRSTLVP
jgi:hypothetical protein